MSEAQRSGQIRLSVDQEVFIEQIMGTDTVDDANVATEVTSFERVGDAYVLEGAIVFAGYLKRSGNNSPWGDQPTNAGYARNVHHRMPFVLRVPIEYQQRGVVNVASRIADWQLEVLGDGWLRMQAELTVSGLNGKRGFHFQCGAQEEGDVFFGRNGQTPVPTDDPFETTLPMRSAGDADSTAYDADEIEAQAEDDEPPQSEATHRNFEEVHRNTRELNPDTVERLSQARVGSANAAAQSSEPVRRGGEGTTDRAPSVDDGMSARRELAHLDRYVNDQGSGSQRVSAPENETTAEFEFEHQLDTSKLVPMDSAVDESVPVAGDESFMASRGFTEQGFHPTDGFVPTVKVGATPGSVDEEIEIGDEVDETRSVDEANVVNESLWSFVDFNAPDPAVMQRHVIVMDDESVESVATRAGCSVEALLNANHFRGEGVYPGLVLRVPERRAPERSVRTRS